MIDFYNKNQGFITDVFAYYSIIEKEYKYIVNEISGYKMNTNSFYIAMIPFRPGINGKLVEKEKMYEFECDTIRGVVGAYLNLKEISEFESENACFLDEIGLNIKKCEIYNEYKTPYPFVRRYGGFGSSSGHEEITTKIQQVFVELGLRKSETLFVSNWIEFGPFIVFFVSEVDNDYYLQYKERTNVDEPDENSYKYFFDTLVNNFYEKWLEFIYYGLYYSTINYISDSQAIITASANDMFESRLLPPEHIFTQIANCEYEGSSCKGKIVFTDDLENIIRFSKSISMDSKNIKKIRKIMEMSGKDVCLVVSISKKEIIGIDNLERHKDSYLLEYIDTNMWNLSYKGVYILKYIDGQYRLPESKLNQKLLLEKCVERFGSKYDDSILKIVEAATEQKHGTMVVISSKAAKETSAIIKEGKGISIMKVNLLNINKELIVGLCSIDGAIMIDPYGNCTGIGLILSSSSMAKGNPERGSRYNSAINYINTHNKSIAVVISEDGMIDIL